MAYLKQFCWVWYFCKLLSLLYRWVLRWLYFYELIGFWKKNCSYLLRNFFRFFQDQSPSRKWILITFIIFLVFAAKIFKIGFRNYTVAKCHGMDSNLCKITADAAASWGRTRAREFRSQWMHHNLSRIKYFSSCFLCKWYTTCQVLI